VVTFEAAAGEGYRCLTIIMHPGFFIKSVQFKNP